MLDLSRIEPGKKDVKAPLGSKWEASATADTEQGEPLKLIWGSFVHL